MALKLVRMKKKLSASKKSHKKTEVEKFLDAIEVQLRLATGETVKQGRGAAKSWVADGADYGEKFVLLPKIGEIIGGSQREERLDVLLERMHEFDMDEDEYSWYVDLRRFGSVPHAGFGLGFERVVQFATGMANIRDVIPFPRTPHNAKF